MLPFSEQQFTINPTIYLKIKQTKPKYIFPINSQTPLY